MQRQIKLLKDSTITRYILNLSKRDLELLWDSSTLRNFDSIEDYVKKELKNDNEYFNFDVEKDDSIVVLIDYDVDCELVRKNIEKSISKYFKLIEK